MKKRGTTAKAKAKTLMRVTREMEMMTTTTTKREMRRKMKATRKKMMGRDCDTSLKM